MGLIVFLLIIIGAIAFWIVGIYNNLQALMQNIREQLSNIQVALKQRIDLTHQIIDIAKSSGDHERQAYSSIQASNQSFQNLQAISQHYPQLQANQTYQNLMNKLENLEAVLLDKRVAYNATVKHYNSVRNRFPAVLIAQKLSFGIAPYYEIEDPDFMEKVKVFERDDSEAIQALVQNSSKAIGQKMQQTQTAVSQKIFEAKNSDEKQESDAQEVKN
nr:LemA family protein [uncultured Moraxella sp.]